MNKNEIIRLSIIGGVAITAAAFAVRERRRNKEGAELAARIVTNLTELQTMVKDALTDYTFEEITKDLDI